MAAPDDEETGMSGVHPERPGGEVVPLPTLERLPPLDSVEHLPTSTKSRDGRPARTEAL